MNEIQNKNILMPNFNYNYNFNLGQMKQIDPNKIDLYNTSLTLFDTIKNSTPNSTLNAKEVYSIYNMTLKGIKETCKNNKLEDISKKAQFYFTLYNIINQKKCQHLEKSEYKCSFINTNIPMLPNNKKIQININNNLFNGAILNPGMFSFNNKNGFFTNNYNNMFLGGFAPKFNNNNCYLFDDEKDNEDTKSKKSNNMDKNEFIGKKRNIDNNAIDEENEVNSKDLKKPNKRNNKENNKKKESSVLTNKQKEIKNKNINSNNNNGFNNKNYNNISNQNETQFTWPTDSEKEEEDFVNFERDLKDYLRRTISETRKNTFFGNILPESLTFVRSLFQKGSNVQINKFYPIYRNNKIELSLIIEPGGKIRKQLTNINI